MRLRREQPWLVLLITHDLAVVGRETRPIASSSCGAGAMETGQCRRGVDAAHPTAPPLEASAAAQRPIAAA